MNKIIVITILNLILLNSINIAAYDNFELSINKQEEILDATEWINKLSPEINKKIIIMLKKYKEYQITNKIKKNKKNLFKNLNYLSKETLKFDEIFIEIIKDKRLKKLFKQEIFLINIYLTEHIAVKEYYKRLLDITKKIKEEDNTVNENASIIKIYKRKMLITMKEIERITGNSKIKRLSRKELKKSIKRN